MVRVNVAGWKTAAPQQVKTAPIPMETRPRTLAAVGFICQMKSAIFRMRGVKISSRIAITNRRPPRPKTIKAAGCALPRAGTAMAVAGRAEGIAIKRKAVGLAMILRIDPKAAWGAKTRGPRPTMIRAPKPMLMNAGRLICLLP